MQYIHFKSARRYHNTHKHNMAKIYFWIFILMCTEGRNDGARILGIFPTPSISHQMPFQIIMKALAARGHQITVITPDPLKKTIENYTEIDTSFSYKHYRSSFDFVMMDDVSGLDLVSISIPALSQIADVQLSSPQVQEFIKSSSNSSYDLVFLEALLYQSYYGLIHHLGSPPVIGILSFECTWTVADAIGMITNPSYIPEVLLYYSDHMTFIERVKNTLFWLFLRYKNHFELYPLQESIMRKHFGSAPPPVYEAGRNMSLLMIGTNWIFGYPAPHPPAVVTYHSLHVKTTPDPLPKDLQQFLDEASDGVIYFSLGTNVLSDRIPEEKRRVFIDAFSELPQKILWKWETDTLPGKPSNVRTGKWLPQQDILAHPKVRLFITQCGLQSFQEAIYHAVPLLGIPFFADQKFNARKIQEIGIGLQLSFKEFTKESLINAINEILKNPSFRDNAKKHSLISRDLPEKSIEKTVWWTEYVLRHKGAKHLRSAALDLEWYQYLLLDVAAFLLTLALIIIAILYYLSICIISYFVGKSKIKFKSE